MIVLLLAKAISGPCQRYLRQGMAVKATWLETRLKVHKGARIRFFFTEARKTIPSTKQLD